VRRFILSSAGIVAFVARLVLLAAICGSVFVGCAQQPPPTPIKRIIESIDTNDGGFATNMTDDDVSGYSFKCLLYEEDNLRLVTYAASKNCKYFVDVPKGEKGWVLIVAGPDQTKIVEIHLSDGNQLFGHKS